MKTEFKTLNTFVVRCTHWTLGTAQRPIDQSNEREGMRKRDRDDACLRLCVCVRLCVFVCARAAWEGGSKKLVHTLEGLSVLRKGGGQALGTSLGSDLAVEISCLGQLLKVCHRVGRHLVPTCCVAHRRDMHTDASVSFLALLPPLP